MMANDIPIAMLHSGFYTSRSGLFKTMSETVKQTARSNDTTRRLEHIARPVALRTKCHVCK